MATTYTPIATTTLTADAVSYTFSSIPQTYTDLVLVTSISRTSSPANAVFRINGDTGTNYSTTYVGGDGAAAFTGRNSNNIYAYIDYTSSSVPVLAVSHFINYSNTSTYKTMINRAGTASTQAIAHVNLWRNTSAINSISVFHAGSGTFTVGSTFTLYGIKAA